MSDQTGTQRIHGYCALCIARCGTVATVERGRFTRLDPDASHPTGQAICAKGRAAPELVYHPERLTHPLRRTRPKGDPDPGWERIGWDEALNLTAAAMRRAAERHGAQAVAFTVSSPSTTAIGDSSGFIRRLASAFGTPNANITLDLCGWGRGFATRYTYGVGSVGTSAGGAMPDIDNSGVLILWGYNPSFTRLTHATAVVEALKRGMRLIVVDPRRVGLAGKADLWLRVRPGTDGALALGLANLMIERGWYDRDFLRDWSNGPHLVRADTGRLLTERDLDPNGRAGRLLAWDGAAARLVPYDTTTGHYDGDSASLAMDGECRVATPQGEVVCHPAFELYTRLCRRYPPEAVEAICWIPRAQVEETARLICTRAQCPTMRTAGTSTTPTSRRRRGRCRCSMPSLARSTGPAAMYCSRRRPPRRSPATSCPRPGTTPQRWALPSARSGQRSGATSAHATSTGPSWRENPTRSAP
jgi:anaerobic selenocysteine-containing dehydrogenase